MTLRLRTITTKKLLSVWREYSSFRQKQISPSTYKYDYQKVERFIERRLPDLNSSTRIKNWLNENYANETSRRMIQQFNAACEWARHEGMLPYNPFEGMGRYFQASKKPKADYSAFTAAERDAIIGHFEQWDPFYAPWVKFLFYTGCRPSEAAAIRWKHIGRDLDSVDFVVSRRPDTGHEQGTKSNDRTFPASGKLRALLWKLEVNRENPETLLLPGFKGGPMNYTNFQTKHWKPHITRLFEQGTIRKDLSQYHTRHTWITMALEHQIPIADVAYLSGNTPNVIYRFYASRRVITEIPDF